MNKYFEDIRTLGELRIQYKELLKLHHPDNCGNLETMQEINAEYDKELSQNNLPYSLSFSPIAPFKNQLHSPLCA